MQNLVVGGGLVGCAVALELVRRGAAVTVLERAVPGAEASSAAAGILAPRVEAHGDVAVRELGLESLGLYDAWVASLEAPVGFRRCGVLVIGERPDAAAIAIGGAALSRIAPGLAAREAWWLPDEAMVDTRLLVDAVRAAAAREGVRFRSGETVLRVDAAGLDLTSAERLAGRVVVCAGAWTSVVGGVPRVPVAPIRGQLAALGETAVTTAVVFGSGGYLVPRSDELVVGTTVEQVGYARGVTVAGVRQVLDVGTSLAPSLDVAPVLRTWSSFRPGSPDGKPVVGQAVGVWIASGHYRNGILLAPLTARLLAAAILEGAALPEAWSPSRF